MPSNQDDIDDFVKKINAGTNLTVKGLCQDIHDYLVAAKPKDRKSATEGLRQEVGKDADIVLKTTMNKIIPEKYDSHNRQEMLYFLLDKFCKDKVEYELSKEEVTASINSIKPNTELSLDEVKALIDVLYPKDRHKSLIPEKLDAIKSSIKISRDAHGIHPAMLVLAEAFRVDDA